MHQGLFKSSSTEGKVIPQIPVSQLKTISSVQSSLQQTSTSSNKGVKYSYEILKNTNLRPKDVDISCLEKYLSTEEFLQVFKMTNTQFSELPVWKKNSIKKTLHLN